MWRDEARSRFSVMAITVASEKGANSFRTNPYTDTPRPPCDSPSSDIICSSSLRTDTENRQLRRSTLCC